MPARNLSVIYVRIFFWLFWLCEVRSSDGGQTKTLVIQPENVQKPEEIARRLKETSASSAS